MKKSYADSIAFQATRRNNHRAGTNIIIYVPKISPILHNSLPGCRKLYHYVLESAMHSLAVALEVVAAAAEHLEVLGYGLAAL